MTDESAEPLEPLEPQIESEQLPMRTRVHYVARVLLGVWIPAALMYELSPGWPLRIAIAVADLAVVFSHGAFRRWLFGAVFGQWTAIDRETVREPGEAGTFSYKVLLVLVMVAVALTLQEYIGDRSYFDRVMHKWASTKYFELQTFAWWSGWRVIGYVILPSRLPRQPAAVLEAPVDLRRVVLVRIARGALRIDDSRVSPHVSVLSARKPLSIRFVDVGSALRSPVRLARIFLPWLHSQRAAPTARCERDLRDDRAVLHDPLRQAAP
jgi:hypothetical protein